MPELFHSDNPVIRFMSTVADCLLLSILWLACSLPIVTIGASTTALYYASIKCLRDEGSPSKNFFKSFRANFKQSIFVELVAFVLLIIMYFLASYAFAPETGDIVKALLFAVLVLGTAVTSYLFPLLSRFVYTTPVLVRNALLLSLTNLQETVSVVILNSLPVLAMFFFPQFFLMSFPVIAALAPGVIARLNAIQFSRVFQKCMSQEQLEKEGLLDSKKTEQDESPLED